MAGFFYKLGQMVGPQLRKADWLYRSLTGTEAEAIRAEFAVGRDLARAVVQQLETDPEPAAAHLLEQVRARLVACLINRQWQFTFRAVRSPEVNAFALPGGFVFVTRPLLEFCRWDPDEAAFVLGHEMAHVVLRHAINRLMASSAVRAALSPAGGALRQPIAGLAATLLNQGYSQDQELEADRLAVRLARAAGFDAAAAARLLARLHALSGDLPVLGSYLSSHPPLEVRRGQVHRALQA
jgi:Zn-dependent protease with chaperone function